MKLDNGSIVSASTTADILKDTDAPYISISFDPIAEDNIINKQESQEPVIVSGKVVSTSAKVGESVSIETPYGYFLATLEATDTENEFSFATEIDVHSYNISERENHSVTATSYGAFSDTAALMQDTQTGYVNFGSSLVIRGSGALYT